MAKRKNVELKIEDEDQGKVSAVFSRFNVVDHDGDVTLPGAFPDGKEVPISAYGHESWFGALPVGKGVIRQTDTEAILEGQFFLDTTTGRDTFAVVKNLGNLQEWSYGFDVIDGQPGQWNGQEVMMLNKIDPHEISPVLKGAGIDTRTLAVKERNKEAISTHSTDTVDAAWDGPANESRLRDSDDFDSDDDTKSYYRRAYAHQFPDTDGTAKSHYSFIHHQVDSDGSVGAANVRGAITGIAALNGARGGADVTNREGVYAHLARHLRDADVTPPELSSLSPESLSTLDEASQKGYTMKTHTLYVLAYVEGLKYRVMSLAELRAKEGRTVSQSNLDRLTEIAKMLSETASELNNFVSEHSKSLEVPALEQSLSMVEAELSIMENE